MRMFSEGAEAKIYLGEFFGRQLLVKVRGAKAYRTAELDLSIRRSRTRSEARVMQALASKGIPVPRLVAVGRFSIYMERLGGRLMKDSACTGREASEAGRILAEMHNMNVVHGDFTPANILIDRGRVNVIDFGLSGFSQDHEEKALDVLLMKRALSGRMYSAFKSSYLKHSVKGGETMARLKEIETRGRYQARTLA